MTSTCQTTCASTAASALASTPASTAAPADSRQYFETVAEDWESLRQGFFPDALRERVADLAAVGDGDLAVDVGAGSGFLSQALLGRGARVVAVDRSQAMLDALEGRLAAAGVPGTADRLTTRHGTATDLGVDDGTADAVVTNMVLHHVDDPAAAIAAMARALRPGGRLVISDLDHHDVEFLRTEHHDRWPGFERVDVRKWLLEAGLEEIEIGDAQANCCGTSSCGERAEINVFVAFGRMPAGA